VLYPHYATLVRPWGPTALEDQRLAAGIMWIAGDAVFITAILAVVVGWMRAESLNERRADRRAEAEMAEIRIKERRLSDRLADERGETGT
jgi:putative copper resistance protein D